MRKAPVSLFANLVTLALLSVGAFAAGPKVQVLHSFTGGTDGSTPVANVIEDASGNLYGTTAAGGSTNSCLSYTGCGVVFEVSAPKALGGAWKETVLYRFSGGADGSNPAGGLVADAAGNLYGTTPYGGDQNNPYCVSSFYKLGCGVVFELSRNQGSWTESVLYTFEAVTDGAYPQGSLVFDSSGNLYGTTSVGGGGPECSTGALIGCGTVFELSPNGSGGWAQSTIYQFQGTEDGGIPLAGMTIDQAGNLYGTTATGGTSDGVVFELSPPGSNEVSWIESILYNFPMNAGQPRAGMIFDPKGNLYGTTSDGSGTAFELSESGGVWTGNTIYSFTGGRFDALTGGLVLDNAGNLYGPTSGPFCGTVYRLQKENGQWNEGGFVLEKGTTGPCYPHGALTFGKWGALYGTSTEGGTCNGNGCGSVFGMLR